MLPNDIGPLLAISTAIATVRDKHVLLAMIFEKLKPAFGFDDAVLVLYDEELAHTQHLHTHTRHEHKEYERIMAAPVPIAGNPYGEFRFYTEPRVVSLAYLREHYPRHPGIALMQALRLVECVVIPLRYGGQLLGVLELHSYQAGHFRPEQFSVFEVLSHQVSVAIANILAHEALLARERRTARQVALINELTQGATWPERLLGFIRSQREFLPIDHLYFFLHLDGVVREEHAYYRIGSDEYQRLDEAAFCRMANVTPAQYRSLRQELDSATPIAQVLTGDDYGEYQRQHPLQRTIGRMFGLRATLMLPLPLSTTRSLLLAVASKDAHAYTQAHLTELQVLLSAVSPTIEKLLAYEEVQALKDQLQQQRAYLMEEVQSQHNFAEIIGESPALQQVLRAIEQVASTATTVLIEGETGTGKELIARAVHHLSPRRTQPLIKVNCAALPPQLIESELFGHERGAFTGALDRRVGKFELAHQGTLFLDEIGELPLELQPKLLRALQEREIERLGGHEVIHTDVRVVVATNRDLRQEVAAGRFRADLYYRLSVFPIRVPALRERREDILPLAQAFISRFSQKLGKAVQRLSAESLQLALRHDWPGNIRELQNVLEHAVITSSGPIVDCQRYFLDEQAVASPVALLPAGWPVDVNDLTLGKLDALKEDLERRFLLQVLQRSNGRVRGAGGAAEALNTPPTTLESRIRKLGIGLVRAQVK
ncbi:sigma-54-dependent Fis family transcriptional regulator [Hymenobacter terrenus]|uniref:sigma-54-dependent Fis family transcriptional regulator n=1 Tax=Hymenobacter terrenus TaxID=1629124 RepID=UPI000697AED0|nr:sigma-54-dependent Fis family transcriptional regulator [Hymenobacter terrenus]